MQDPSLYHQQMNLNSQFPGHEQLKCPRCDSTNTKFCYYNNYNLSQPRHYCKSCRRHWTKGGSLRNIPVGGGSRKCSKSGSSSSRRNPSPNSSLSSPSDANQKGPKSETSIGYKPIDRNHQLFDTSGTLGSLLPESGKLWSLFEGVNARGFARTPNLSLQPGSDPNLIPDPVVEFQGDIDTGCFLGVENRGDSSRWASNNGWPDFAI